MPRQSRIDAPGALNHIIARGINRKKIFNDDADRYNFLSRLSEILTDAHTACFAWALVPITFSPFTTNRLGSNLYDYATAFNRLCDELQSQTPSSWPPVSKLRISQPAPGP